jgi:hypothetical protein
MSDASSAIRYRRMPDFEVSTSIDNPRRLRTVPDRNPRTLWGCHLVALANSSSEAPRFDRRRLRINSALVVLFPDFGRRLPCSSSLGGREPSQVFVTFSKWLGLSGLVMFVSFSSFDSVMPLSPRKTRNQRAGDKPMHARKETEVQSNFKRWRNSVGSNRGHAATYTELPF